MQTAKAGRYSWVTCEVQWIPFRSQLSWLLSTKARSRYCVSSCL